MIKQKSLKRRPLIAVVALVASVRPTLIINLLINITARAVKRGQL
jgi:hypothetical protein